MSRRSWSESQRKSNETNKELEDTFSRMWKMKHSLQEILKAHNIAVKKCRSCSQYIEMESDTALNDTGIFICELCVNTYVKGEDGHDHAWLVKLTQEVNKKNIKNSQTNSNEYLN